MDKQKILLAGKIASEVKKYARSFIKKNMLLLEIAEKIETKIIELGGKPAFPVNTSINDVAAHYTPFHDDVSIAKGLLKVDLGVHVDGYVADTAFSIDLENSKENQDLIKASEQALENAIKILKEKIKVSEIGKIIEETISSKGFQPVINLSGHQIEHYDLHAGLTIPNIDDERLDVLKKGLYAIEPFATNGSGKVRDGKSSGIYQLVNLKTPRSSDARKILKYISEEYESLPFCSRWIVKKFGAKALFTMKQLEEFGNLHQYSQLVESGNGIVAQAEHTILIDESGKIEVTTK